MCGAWGADIINYIADLDGNGAAEYIIALGGVGGQLKLRGYNIGTGADFTLDPVASPGQTVPASKNYGSGWNYQGKIFFSDNSGSGVFKCAIDQVSFGNNQFIIQVRRWHVAPHSEN